MQKRLKKKVPSLESQREQMTVTLLFVFSVFCVASVFSRTSAATTWPFH